MQVFLFYSSNSSYPNNVAVVQTGEDPIADVDAVVVTDIARDENGLLVVVGKKFLNLEAAHSEWNVNLKYASMKSIGCYEARAGLSSSTVVYPFSEVVGKCFPFHMILQSDSDPSRWETGNDQWWVLIRLKHTCPPVTFPD